ncbi:MAG: hypothetical protein CL489_10310 [Acidobacteria bacterium]|nr:hypothetical protein [Acidobacteriota bacterium]|tara:strand:+ start:10927 stop:11337 length:411 start_codon:yes stop_codon:yes gene_type:complete
MKIDEDEYYRNIIIKGQQIFQGTVVEYLQHRKVMNDTKMKARKYAAIFELYDQIGTSKVMCKRENIQEIMDFINEQYGEEVLTMDILKELYRVRNWDDEDLFDILSDLEVDNDFYTSYDNRSSIKEELEDIYNGSF